MKMFDVNGEMVNVDVRERSYPMKKSSRSKIQQNTGEILRSLMPREVILEEFSVPSSRLKVDFFVPLKEIVVEVQGKQHNEHVPFFHGDKKTSVALGKQRQRDIQKNEWIDRNGFILVEIFEGMSDDAIRSKIRGQI